MPDKIKPLALFYGGTNGSGKSSLRMLEKRKIKHIDPDEIARNMNLNDVRSADTQAGREAIRQFRECLHNKTPFSLESTLSGNSSIRRMQDALNSGFNVELHFVGLESVSLNVERVSERVENGGHHIDEEVILTPHASIDNNMRAILLEKEAPNWIQNAVKKYDFLLEKRR